MKILLTGSNGQLGRAIRKEYGDSAEFVLTEVIESPDFIHLDIADVDAVLSMVRDTKPDIIINCAAFTNVDGCEVETDAAYRANAIGPRNLAIASRECGCKLVHISTDYVFAGNGTRPYTEFDAPSPKSAYGRTKLAGEEFVKQFADKFFILRTAWLYGDGKNFVKTMVNLSKNHDEVSVVMDQKGSPTTAKELAKMIHYLAETNDYGLYHATCEGDTNWADFTESIYKKLGIKTKVNHVTSAQYKEMNPQSADRPAYSILDNYMLRLVNADFKMAAWEDALDDYLKDAEF